MSISDAINNARQKINNVYDALEAKGAIMPEVRTLDHMVTTIEGLPQLSNLVNWTYSGSNGTLGLETYNGDYSSTVTLPNMKNLFIYKLPEKVAATQQYNVPFYKNEEVVAVNLNNVPFEDNNMHHSFWNCFNLTSVESVNSSVTNMGHTFSNCYNFNSNLILPEALEDMSYTFWNCSRFNQPVTIPNSVVDMTYAFYGCSSFNQPVTIPNSVTDVYSTFYNCSQLNSTMTLGNSITDMSNTFYNCSQLNSTMILGNSITNMSNSFNGCQNFANRIYLYSEEVSDVSDCFNRTEKMKTVYLPFNYSNGEHTTTYNSFRRAGYYQTQQGSIIVSGANGVCIYDINAQ